MWKGRSPFAIALSCSLGYVPVKIDEILGIDARDLLVVWSCAKIGSVFCPFGLFRSVQFLVFAFSLALFRGRKSIGFARNTWEDVERRQCRVSGRARSGLNCRRPTIRASG